MVTRGLRGSCVHLSNHNSRHVHVHTTQDTADAISCRGNTGCTALGVDLEDLSASLEVGKAKLDLAVQAARAHQRRVQSVWAVGRHEHLDVAPRVEAIQLVDDLEHGALHLVVTARAVIEARTTNGIHLVEEHDACLLGPRHLHGAESSAVSWFLMERAGGHGVGRRYWMHVDGARPVLQQPQVNKTRDGRYFLLDCLERGSGFYAEFRRGWKVGGA